MFCTHFLPNVRRLRGLVAAATSASAALSADETGEAGRVSAGELLDEDDDGSGNLQAMTKNLVVDFFRATSCFSLKWTIDLGQVWS